LVVQGGSPEWSQSQGERPLQRMAGRSLARPCRHGMPEVQGGGRDGRVRSAARLGGAVGPCVRAPVVH
jgi:hypothetical protein